MCYKRSSAGFSGKSQILYAQVFMTRYLNYCLAFQTFDWTLLFLAASMLSIYLIYKQFRRTNEIKNDRFWIEFLQIPCIWLAFVWNNNPLEGDDKGIVEANFQDTASAFHLFWAFSVYLEAVAMVPQFYLIAKKTEIETNVKYYLLTLAAYRASYILHCCQNYYVYGDEWNTILLAGCVVQVTLYCLFYIYMYIIRSKPNHYMQNIENHFEQLNIPIVQAVKPATVITALDNCTALDLQLGDCSMPAPEEWTVPNPSVQLLQ